MTRDLCVSIASSAHRANLEALLGWRPFPMLGEPDEVWTAARRAPANEWQSCLRRTVDECLVLWNSLDAQIEYLPKSQVLTFAYPKAFGRPTEAMAVVEPMSFGVVTFGSLFRKEWGPEGRDYKRWGFGRSMVDHGWACAFRGDGHGRLVSRRWLDFGPWRVIRRPNDTTFIQFHDLAITDPAEAYEQAKVGHQRMGVDPIGGYIQSIALDVIAQVNGVYRANERTLDIVVAPGIEVRQQDMRVACGLRLHHRLTKPVVDRVDRIAYVFADKADAQAHLHELWLRELECWYLDENGKHRLDADYHPTPSPPAWVKAVETRGD